MPADLDAQITELIEKFGFTAVRKALDGWQAERIKRSEPLPEMISIDELYKLSRRA